MIQIPLLNSPSQTFTIAINDVEYSIRVIYNTREETWSMDITGGSLSAAGINLVGGVDLLVQHSIPIDNIYMINVSGLTTDPTIDNLNTDFALIIATDAEVLEAIELGQTV